MCNAKSSVYRIYNASNAAAQAKIEIPADETWQVEMPAIKLYRLVTNTDWPI